MDLEIYGKKYEESFITEIVTVVVGQFISNLNIPFG